MNTLKIFPPFAALLLAACMPESDPVKILETACKTSSEKEGVATIMSEQSLGSGYLIQHRMKCDTMRYETEALPIYRTTAGSGLHYYDPTRPNDVMVWVTDE